MCVSVVLEQASSCTYAVHTCEEIALTEWGTGFVCIQG